MIRLMVFRKMAICFLMVFVFNQSRASGFPDSIRLLPSSKLEIHGASNVNDFTCKYTFDKYPDQVMFNVEKKGRQHIVDSVKVKIPVQHFRCNNRMMKKDFMRTLKAEQFPAIEMCMPSFILINLDNIKRQPSEVILTIGGKTGKTEVAYSLNRTEYGVYQMKGSAKVDITDFNLEPVSRLFGIVKVDKEVEIRFLFNFAIGESNRTNAIKH